MPTQKVNAATLKKGDKIIVQRPSLVGSKIIELVQEPEIMMHSVKLMCTHGMNGADKSIFDEYIVPNDLLVEKVN